jgi:hypothetical protein
MVGRRRDHRAGNQGEGSAVRRTGFVIHGGYECTSPTIGEPTKKKKKNKPPPIFIVDAIKRHDRMLVRWHDLRRTCGSSLIAGWWGRRWSMIEVRDMLGHRSVTTTERYAHLSESALQQAARDTYLPEISPEPEEAISNSPTVTLAPPRRLERPTNGLGNRCSIH